MLNAEQLQRYRRDGQITAPARLAAGLVDEMRDRMEAFFAETGADPDYAPNLIEQDRSWLDYAARPEILDLVGDVIGDDIIVWGSALFAKKGAGGKATPWHQDGQYWPIRPLATVTVWIAIDDVDTDNGCLRVIPGSHRDRTLHEHRHDGSDDIVLSQALDMDDGRFAAPRDIILKPGEFSVHDVYLVHGAEPNNSGRRRGGLTFRYMPSTSYYDRELARRQAAEMGVLDISERQLNLVRGVDRSGRNDVWREAVG